MPVVEGIVAQRLLQFWLRELVQQVHKQRDYLRMQLYQVVLFKPLRKK